MWKREKLTRQRVEPSQCLNTSWNFFHICKFSFLTSSLFIRALLFSMSYPTYSFIDGDVVGWRRTIVEGYLACELGGSNTSKLQERRQRTAVVEHRPDGHHVAYYRDYFSYIGYHFWEIPCEYINSCMNLLFANDCLIFPYILFDGE